MMASRESINRFLFTLFGFEKPKSRAHIVLIVGIHMAGWCLLFLLPLMLYPVRINDGGFIWRELIDKSIFVILFYLNYYWLIPRFFEKRRYLAYTSLVLVAFLFYLLQHGLVRSNFLRPGGGLQIVQMAAPSGANDSFGPTRLGIRKMRIGNGIIFRMDSMPAHLHHVAASDSLENMLPPFPLRELGPFNIPKGLWMMTLNNAISSFSLLLLMGGFIRLSFSFARNQNEKKALENANLNAEVNFLRSQINPHFLFNTLNSIYAQAHSRSDNTEYSILKLSELLRYVLYDSGEDRVDLARDIQYINNYIALQRLRLSPKIRLHYSVTGNALNGKTIAPLLLINFIENAFKHGISYTQASTIDIAIEIFEKTLTLSVSNPILEKDSFGPGGLGLKNVIRRLELLYPGMHQLDISRQNSLYIVKLKLDLTSA